MAADLALLFRATAQESVPAVELRLGDRTGLRQMHADHAFVRTLNGMLIILRNSSSWSTTFM